MCAYTSLVGTSKSQFFLSVYKMFVYVERGGAAGRDYLRPSCVAFFCEGVMPRTVRGCLAVCARFS